MVKHPHELTNTLATWSQFLPSGWPLPIPCLLVLIQTFSSCRTKIMVSPRRLIRAKWSWLPSLSVVTRQVAFIKVQPKSSENPLKPDKYCHRQNWPYKLLTGISPTTIWWHLSFKSANQCFSGRSSQISMTKTVLLRPYRGGSEVILEEGTEFWLINEISCQQEILSRTENPT